MGEPEDVDRRGRVVLQWFDAAAESVRSSHVWRPQRFSFDRPISVLADRVATGPSGSSGLREPDPAWW
jgi:hypothetical protein